MKQSVLWFCKLLLSLLPVCCLQQVNAQHVSFAWANGIGGTIWDCAEAVTVDPAGNVYVIGWFSTSVDHYPGANNPTPSAGGYDALLAKYDPAGVLLWSKNMGGSGQDNGYGITLDATGAIYVTGYFIGTADFNPGGSGGQLTGPGGRDVFLAKYDFDGNYIWAKCMGGTDNDWGYNVAVDADGNVVVAGMYISSGADFDPGPGTAVLNPVGIWDVFTAKYDADGNYIWAFSVGGVYHDYCQGVTVDDAGSIYITGMFESPVDFDPGPGAAYITPVSQDAFLAKYDANGNYQWVRRLGGSSVDRGYNTTADGSGNVYVTGVVMSSDFDAGGGILPAAGTGVFLAKYNAGGNYVWGKNLGGGGGHRFGVGVDAADNVYITGDFRATMNLDQGAPAGMFSPGADLDAFLVKYDPAGNYIWAKGIGGNNAYAVGTGVFIDSTGNIHVSGEFGDAPVDFDPGAGVSTLTPVTGLQGFGDMFIFKLACTDTTSSYQKITACTEYYTLNGITYTSTGSYQQHFINTAGCDSTLRLDLTLVQLDSVPNSLGDDKTMFFCDHPDSYLELKVNIHSNGASYLWQDGSTGSSYQVTEPGIYWVEVSNEQCIASDTVRIEGVKDIHFSDTTFCKGDPIDIILSTPEVPSGTIIQWSTGSAEPSIQVTNTGLYWLSLIYPPCILNDSARIESIACDCFAQMGNAFSPNGDGLNDYFLPVIETGCPIKTYTFNVYNRFGERIFFSSDPARGWDGLYKGSPADVGTYFYELHFTGGTRQRNFYFKGDIVLIR